MDIIKLTTTISAVITALFSAAVLIIGIISWMKGSFKFIKNFNKTSKIINVFSEEILPSAIEGCEKKGILPPQTLVQWTKIIANKYAPAHSPRELNEAGKTILEKSGLRQIIDDNIQKFLGYLEQKNLKTPLDIEKQCFYALKEIENTEMINPIKTYLYSHPNQEINSIFFIGSIYLRNKYKDKYPDLFKLVAVDKDQ